MVQVIETRRPANQRIASKMLTVVLTVTLLTAMLTATAVHFQRHDCGGQQLTKDRAILTGFKVGGPLVKTGNNPKVSHDGYELETILRKFLNLMMTNKHTNQQRADFHKFLKTLNAKGVHSTPRTAASGHQKIDGESEQPKLKIQKFKSLTTKASHPKPSWTTTPITGRN